MSNTFCGTFYRFVLPVVTVSEQHGNQLPNVLAYGTKFIHRAKFRQKFYTGQNLYRFSK